MNNKQSSFGFNINHKSELTDELGLIGARTGTIFTPHGNIETPAFIPVATAATMKGLLPEYIEAIGGQALLSNAYHLFIRDTDKVIEACGGLGNFMNWDKPTFTDSGGFQVMSLGAGFQKVISMEEVPATSVGIGWDKKKKTINPSKEQLAFVDDDGVTFKSHLSGAKIRFSPEISMQIQHRIGADIIFAFDELTTIFDSKQYQEESVERTFRWAKRCVDEIKVLRQDNRPYQALFGVVQGAQYEDLRRLAASQMGSLDFDGFGIGGALQKSLLKEIIRWCIDELPENKPRHLLGIAEIDDLFNAVQAGIDTFDCVSPARVGRNGAAYNEFGRFNVRNAKYRLDFSPIQQDCDCYTCTHYTKAYICHLFKAKEINAGVLTSIHNERFIIRLVDKMRETIKNNDFLEFKKDFLARFAYKK